MVDTRDARHVLRGDLHFADDRTFKKVITDGQVLLNRVLDILEGFFLGDALRPAPGQPGDRHAVPLIRLQDSPA